MTASLHTLRFISVACGLGGLAFYAGARPRAEVSDPPPGHVTSDRARATDPLKVFAREERDPDWASSVEAWLSRSLATDLQGTVPAATGVQVECRTTTCKIAWQSNDVDDQKVRMVLRLLYRPLSTTQRVANQCVVSFKENGHPRMDQTSTVDALKRTRTKAVEEIHAGSVLDRFYGASDNRKGRLDWIPPEHWPTK